MFEILLIVADLVNIQLAVKLVTVLMLDDATTGKPVLYDAERELSETSCDCNCVDVVAVRDDVDINDELN